MADDLSSATAATITVKLSDRDITFTPLNLHTLGELEQMRRQTILDAAITSLGRNGISGALAEQVLRQAYDAMQNVSFGMTMTTLGTADALNMIWLAARKHHPDMTVEQMAELLPGNQIEYLAQQLMQISGLAGEEVSGTESGNGKSIQLEDPVSVDA
jgi:hypothetical protein